MNFKRAYQNTRPVTSFLDDMICNHTIANITAIQGRNRNTCKYTSLLRSNLWIFSSTSSRRRTDTMGHPSMQFQAAATSIRILLSVCLPSRKHPLLQRTGTGCRLMKRCWKYPISVIMLKRLEMVQACDLAFSACFRCVQTAARVSHAAPTLELSETTISISIIYALQHTCKLLGGGPPGLSAAVTVICWTRNQAHTLCCRAELLATAANDYRLVYLVKELLDVVSSSVKGGSTSLLACCLYFEQRCHHCSLRSGLTSFNKLQACVLCFQKMVRGLTKW